MNILIINISLRPNSPVKLFPLGLGYIATSVKNSGFDFDLLDIDAHRYSDNELEKRLRAKKYDVVCMGCIVTGYRIVKSLAVMIKECNPNAKIIAGNSVATSIPDILLSKTKVDIAVMGEGDETIVELLKTIAQGESYKNIPGICFKEEDKVIRTPFRPLINNISLLPFIDYSLFDIETYILASRFAVNDPLPILREEIRALPINTSRGCIADCSFCYQVFKGSPYRFRSPDSVIKEIKLLINRYKLNYIIFSDEVTFFSKKQTIEFIDKILDSKLHFYWSGCCRGNLFNNDNDIEIIIKMKESGCINMSYSLESADASILKAMNKHVTVEQFSKQTELFARTAIPTVTSLVFGYPQETPQTIKNTIDCCIKNRVYPSAGYLLPQPGSEMYEYAIRHGFIDDEEEYLLKIGDRQDLHLNMTKMSDEDLKTNVLEGLRRCNRELNIGLEEENLIKTLFVRGRSESREIHKYFKV